MSAYGPTAETAAGHAVAWDASRRASAFAAARRHTRYVRLLRKALPASCLAVLVSVVVLARASIPEGLDFSMARTTISNGAVVMHQPRLTGYDKENRSYRVSAETASQKLTNPDEVDLTKVVAEVRAPDRGEIIMRAGGGSLVNGEGRLLLHGGVEVESADGYSIRLDEVEVHFNEGRLASDSPVAITYTEGHTSAESLTVTDNGKLVVLEGRVKTTFRAPAAAVPAAAAPATSVVRPVAGNLARPGALEIVR